MSLTPLNFAPTKNQYALSTGTSDHSFIKDFFIYIGRMSQFTKTDWAVYTAWIGLMFGLFFAVTSFLLLGHFQGVTYPTYVWNIPVGIFIFCLAIAIDTIGHRTVYKDFINQGENLVHHLTIFAGITSVLGLCLSYNHPAIFKYPSLVLIALSIIYSLIDEALHWHRYLHLKSDRIEMWSHFFILFGHLWMITAWWVWMSDGYPGVAQTLVHF